MSGVRQASRMRREARRGNVLVLRASTRSPDDADASDARCYCAANLKKLIEDRVDE
jgi:hypothetical protein